MPENDRYAEIIPLVRLPRGKTVFDYHIPVPLAGVLEKGMVVTIPFRKRQTAGIVFSVKDNTHIPETHIQEIIHLDDSTPLVGTVFLDALVGVADDLCISRGLFLRNALPSPPLRIRGGRGSYVEYQHNPLLVLNSPPYPKGENDIFVTITSRSALKEFLKEIVDKTNVEKKTIFILFPLREQADAWAHWFRAQNISIFHAVPELGKIAHYNAWQKIQRGEIRVVIGTRHTIFFEPPPESTYVLVDETAPEWKQEDMNPRYDARVILPQLAAATSSSIIRTGAMPTIETYYKQEMVILNEVKDLARMRVGSHPREILRSVQNDVRLKIILVNLKDHWRSGNQSCITDQLLEALKNAKRALLFVHRLGRGTVLRCRDCHHLFRCTACETAFAVHRAELRCPLCRTTLPFPFACPLCNGSRLATYGTGTERVEDELVTLLGDAARNHAVGSVGLTNKLKSEVAPRPFDLVAIVDADGILHRPDFGSAEKLAATVADCATLAAPEAPFIIQTAFPDLAVWDQTRFFEAELAERDILHWPPYYGIAKLMLQDKDPETAEKKARMIYEQLREALKSHPTIELIGPYRASPFISHGRASLHILVRYPREIFSDIRPHFAALSDDIIIDFT